MTNGCKGSNERRYLAALSTLLLDPRGDSEIASPALQREVRYVAQLEDAQLHELLDLAAAHHVTVRGIDALQRTSAVTGEQRLAQQLEIPLATEHRRIENALEVLSAICYALESAGCPVTVIKSLDHSPDLGGDLDLYTSGDKDPVLEVLTKEFDAQLEVQSWGDRLANKWNFHVPGLPELVECHVKWLGQTGEQVALAARLEQRRVKRKVGHHVFPVPAPEERIIVATLQRMYRHFYIRLCDIVNIARLVRTNAVNFAELKETADLGSIWPGVATLLVIVSEYVHEFGANPLDLPFEVMAAARFSGQRTYLKQKFLRIPIVPEAAELYRQQMIGIGVSRNFRAMFRLSLLPALATAAFLGYRLTGSDKGIW